MVFLYGAGEYPVYCAALRKIEQQSLISQDLNRAKKCQGLLLPGGGDIHGDLDDRETSVIRYFVLHRLPILGICRGMQALNVYFGGTLYDSIPDHQAPGRDIEHPTRTDGFMAALLGKATTVNSNHHQAVKEIGAGLIVCQQANDGIVEAIRHRVFPILGVQWHPERWHTGSAVFHWFSEEMSK